LEMNRTIDKLVTAIQAERERQGGEGRRVFLDFDDATHLRYDLTAREASGFLRSEKNQDLLRERIGAESVKYRPSKYHRASGGGGHGPGFIKYYTSPGSRRPTSVAVKFGETATSSSHAVKKKSAAQLEREIAAALKGSASKDDAEDEGVFFITNAREHPLGAEFRSFLAAKRAAMKLVRERAQPLVEVWHRWQGGRYLQGVAKEDGWSDV
jgi:hypothetical protein